MARKSAKTKSAKAALTHIDSSGEARMVDVSEKPATERTAVLGRLARFHCGLKRLG